jgi:hypothetical protein
VIVEPAPPIKVGKPRKRVGPGTKATVSNFNLTCMTSIILTWLQNLGTVNVEPLGESSSRRTTRTVRELLAPIINVTDDFDQPRTSVNTSTSTRGKSRGEPYVLVPPLPVSRLSFISNPTSTWLRLSEGPQALRTSPGGRTGNRQDGGGRGRKIYGRTEPCGPPSVGATADTLVT